MEFEVPKHDKENLEKYSDEAKTIAYDFSARLLKEMKGLVKGVVLFGSAARKRQQSNDIDLLIVVDDLSVELTKPLVQGYRVIVKKLVSDVSEKLHVTTLRYTTFWEYARAGDPVGVNILRDGVALYDTGFFIPLQRLLYTGRIRPSAESIWTYYGRTGISLENAKGKLLGATLDLYWAVMDASHAALMRVGDVPPSPEHVPQYLKEKLVKTGMLEPKWPGICKEFYDLMKHISHRDVKEIKGELHDHYARLASDYVERMKRIIEQ